jgi:CheY-like chemotaxis protein
MIGTRMAVRVLIVDDEPDAVETCTRLLERWDVICLKAYSGVEAIELIDAERPNLVITDFNMPGPDGLQVAKHAQTTLPPIPVILVTAYHNPSTEFAARRTGVTDYLVKPFTNDELMVSVKQALGESGLGHRRR